MGFHQKSVSAHQFAMIPRADIPRAAFQIDFTHKTTFDPGYLIPVFCEEVLPGDSFSVNMTAFARLATPIFPLMDNMHLDSFFFFVPSRLVWYNFVRFMGEQDDPGDTTSFVIPTVTVDATNAIVSSIYDYMGLPLPLGDLVVNSLPFRAYNLIYNQWFRDQNLIDSARVELGDGPDTADMFVVRKRAKRADYFTTALPWPQKGQSVGLPLGGTAPVVPTGDAIPRYTLAGTSVFQHGKASDDYAYWSTGNLVGNATWEDPKLIADLSTATAATINQLRQAFQIQRLLERDARGGTRYTEIVRSHFGVVSPDARLQRAEYLGGSSDALTIVPIPQTSASGTYADTPQGNLAAMGQVVGRASWSQAFTEHGYIIGIVNVRGDVTYQQGLRKMWSRSTRYDFYFPAFAMLGEQAVLSKEIYCDGYSQDEQVFGYQERWSEYRYAPNRITGHFRSASPTTLDPWHLAEEFATRPVLNQAFVEDATPIDRVIAVTEDNAALLFDSVFKMRVVRPMPAYSVPGMIDHF